jgi:hypothetical protein
MAPSFAATDIATVVGLALVSLARIALGTGKSALGMMKTLKEIELTAVRVLPRSADDRDRTTGD